MEEQLVVNTSTDLLNEFLGQNNNEPIDNSNINDDPNKETETIVPEIDNSLEFINELPEAFKEEPPIEEENNKQTETPKSTGDYSFKALAGFLSEEGVIDFEDSDDLEDNQEVLIDSVRSTIAKEIQAYKESLSDKGKGIIEYLEQGGSIDEYLNKAQKPFDFSKIDLESEKDQEIVTRENLRLQGYEQSEIDETIQDYKDSLILDKQAKLSDKQVKKFYEKQQEAVLQNQQIEEAQRVEQYRTYISTINNSIDTSESIAGLNVDSKDKIAFKQYLLGRDKEGLTSYERDLQEDPVKTQLELAYLKFKKYDFSKAAKQGETKATQRIKDIFKKSETNNTSGKSVEEVSRSENQFEAFRSFASKR